MLLGRVRPRLAAGLLALLLAVPLAAQAEGGLTPSQARGKAIYMTGQPVSGPEILAEAAAGVEVPATVLPCSSCHGFDGQGRPEGGVTPSNVTWPALTKSYGLTHPNGREHGPYDERSLLKAITLGVDPAGNQLERVMPRYRLSSEQADDLVAYLLVIHQDRDPGIGEDSLRIGTVLPPGPAGAAVEGILTAYFDQVNEGGGIYSRRLELVTAAGGRGPGAAAAALATLLERQPFALVAPYLVGSEGEAAALLDEGGVPAVGAVTPAPPLGFPLNRYLFYLYSGVAGQGRALVQWAAEQGAAPAAVLYRDDEPAAGAAEAAATALARAGHAVERVAYRPGARPGAAEVAAARAADAERLFFFGTGQELLALLSTLGDAGWSPQLLAPGPLVADGLGALPDDLGSSLLVAFPTLPIDHSAEALKLRHELAAAAGVEEGQDAAQLAALAAAELLFEGLKRAGRDLAREKLVTVLEGLYEFQTGVTRPLTYSPNQRVGAAGAYLLEVDAAERSFGAPEWVAVDD